MKGMQKINRDENTMEAQIIEAGYLLLSGEELNLKMQNKTIFGEYLYGRQYISYAYSDGTVEGENDLGSQVKGRWSINKKNKTLTLKWSGYWDEWTGRAYDVDGEIKFFDIETSHWRTTFNKFKDENFFTKSKTEFDSEKKSFFRTEK